MQIAVCRYCSKAYPKCCVDACFDCLVREMVMARIENRIRDDLAGSPWGPDCGEWPDDPRGYDIDPTLRKALGAHVTDLIEWVTVGGDYTVTVVDAVMEWWWNRGRVQEQAQMSAESQGDLFA